MYSCSVSLSLCAESSKGIALNADYGDEMGHECSQCGVVRERLR